MKIELSELMTLRDIAIDEALMNEKRLHRQEMRAEQSDKYLLVHALKAMANYLEETKLIKGKGEDRVLKMPKKMLKKEEDKCLQLADGVFGALDTLKCFEVRLGQNQADTKEVFIGE